MTALESHYLSLFYYILASIHEDGMTLDKRPLRISVQNHGENNYIATTET